MSLQNQVWPKPSGLAARYSSHNSRRVTRLRERRSQMAGRLSGGEHQMLAFGRAARERRRDDRMLEQNARVALAIAHEGHVLETGRPVLSGPVSEPAQDPRIIETYLASVVS
jgi:branched-chain amino acid transport system ATP-binding protein